MSNVLELEGIFLDFYGTIAAGDRAAVESACARVIAAVPSVPTLAPLEKCAVWTLPPMPAAETFRMLVFMREVFARYRSEAGLLLAQNPTTGEFTWVCPEQEVSSGKCKYDPATPMPEGCLLAGTIHSHGAGSAFHSGTDTHDEESADGIHLTIGHVDEELVDLVASLKVGSERFEKDPADILGGVLQPKAKDIVPAEAPSIWPLQARCVISQRSEQWLKQ